MCPKTHWPQGANIVSKLVDPTIALVFWDERRPTSYQPNLPVLTKRNVAPRAWHPRHCGDARHCGDVWPGHGRGTGDVNVPSADQPELLEVKGYENYELAAGRKIQLD
jgi:hypothetical protein